MKLDALQRALPDASPREMRQAEELFQQGYSVEQIADAFAQMRQDMNDALIAKRGRMAVPKKRPAFPTRRSA